MWFLRGLHQDSQYETGLEDSPVFFFAPVILAALLQISSDLSDTVPRNGQEKQEQTA